jgi:hypothetical protein
MKVQSKWTREELMGPYKTALAWEGSVDGGDATWCALVQAQNAGLKNLDDYNRVETTAKYFTDSKEFENTSVTYEKTDNGATFNILSHNKYYGTSDADTSCLKPAMEIGCKMASADRVAE